MSFIPVPCLPDLGTVTIDGGTVTIDGGTVTVIEGGDFTPVAASRWFDTGSDDLSLLGTTDLTLLSPTPAAGQVVVVNDLSYFIEVAAGLSLTVLSAEVRQVSDSTVLWQASIGFTATAGLGSTNSFGQSDIYVYGGDGEQLEYVITIGTGIGVTVSVSANFGGHIATL